MCVLVDVNETPQRGPLCAIWGSIMAMLARRLLPTHRDAKHSTGRGQEVVLGQAGGFGSGSTREPLARTESCGETVGLFSLTVLVELKTTRGAQTEKYVSQINITHIPV